MNDDTSVPEGATLADGAASETSLRDLKSGTSCVVQRVRADGELRRRLLEMGFISGTPVRVVRRAPLGDPIAVVLHGYHLSIRSTDAETILVTCN